MCQIFYVQKLISVAQVIPYTEDGMGLAKRLRAVAHELERVTIQIVDVLMMRIPMHANVDDNLNKKIII